MVQAQWICMTLLAATFGRDRAKMTTYVMLIIMITATLFPAPMVAFANSTIRNAGSFSLMATGPQTILTPNARQSTTPAFTALHMLDKMHGWKLLAGTSVLKTSDGGNTWNDVTPPNFPVQPGLRGTFMSQNVAWIVGMTKQKQIIIQRTSDGGNHWKSSQMADGSDPTAAILYPPTFISAQEGWLDVERSISGTGATQNDLFYTTDGGSHWRKLATNEQIHQNASLAGVDTGISFKNAQNGWNTVEMKTNMGIGMKTGTMSNVPMVFVTHNGGQTWQRQTLPPFPGQVSSSYRTTPPVFFGNNGLMPVTIPTGLSFYTTTDGGGHWSSGSVIPLQVQQLAILDQQHIWIISQDRSVHQSTDGGKTWKTLGSIGKPASAMSFSDTNNGWIVPEGENASLLHTADGGRTWQQINAHLQTLSPKTKPAIGLQVGNISPDFTLMNLSNKPVSLHDFRGKPVMLSFWYPSCTDCQNEIPTIQRYYTSKQAVSQHFVILGVNTLGGDDKQTVQNYVQQNHLTYPIVMDDQQRVGTLYHVRETPTSYFLDPQGIIQSILFGPVGKSKLQLVLTDPKKANGMTQGG
jgi:photosystem II stability/assembly factor-like uncharacterized protein/peroxiredoxin